MFELIQGGHVLILVSAIGSTLTGLSLLFEVYVTGVRQKKAYAGDIEAGLKIILPCYRPLFYGLALLFFLLAGGQILSLLKEYNIYHVYFVLQYHSLCLVAAYSISPVLLVQHSVSYSCFLRTFFIIFPYWVIMTIIWGLSYHFLLLNDNNRHFILQVVLIFLMFLPPFILSIAILRRWVVSRVQLGSRSNRCSSEFLFAYSLLFFGINCFNIFSPKFDFHIAFNVALTLVIVDLMWNSIFTLALHRSLLADTKFWRGIGTHNAGGLNSERQDDGQLPMPSMDVTTASFAFQDMMTTVGKIVIDFAYLEVKQRIGDGATSKVYSGNYKRNAVAIKISTPTEITSEVIDVFVKEGLLSQSLQHQNVVKFFGLCVRPPQIAMVMELCAGGNLKSAIANSPKEWTTLKRLNACLGASRAVAYIHGEGYIHRDIKTENFFLTEAGKVKLGDFGESRKAESNRDSLGGRRMTILGTVSYMAPELVAASKFYTTAVDIFALGITFWEIWTGLSAYGDRSQFEVYKMVESGNRPDVSSVMAPAAFIALMIDAWHQDPDHRPEAKELVTRLEALIRDQGGEVEPEIGGIATSVLATQGPVGRLVSSLRMPSSNALSPPRTLETHDEYNSSFSNSVRLTEIEDRKTDVRFLPLGHGQAYANPDFTSVTTTSVSSATPVRNNSTNQLAPAASTPPKPRSSSTNAANSSLLSSNTLTPLLPTHFEHDAEAEIANPITVEQLSPSGRLAVMYPPSSPNGHTQAQTQIQTQTQTQIQTQTQTQTQTQAQLTQVQVQTHSPTGANVGTQLSKTNLDPSLRSDSRSLSNTRLSSQTTGSDAEPSNFDL